MLHYMQTSFCKNASHLRQSSEFLVGRWRPFWTPLPTRHYDVPRFDYTINHTLNFMKNFIEENSHKKWFFDVTYIKNSCWEIPNPRIHLKIVIIVKSGHFGAKTALYWIFYVTKFRQNFLESKLRFPTSLIRSKSSLDQRNQRLVVRRRITKSPLTPTLFRL